VLTDPETVPCDGAGPADGVEMALPPSVLAGWSGISFYSDPQALRAKYEGATSLYVADAHSILAAEPSLQLLQQPGPAAHFGLSPRVPMLLDDFNSRLSQLTKLFQPAAVAAAVV
jgi:hypothetical protein